MVREIFKDKEIRNFFIIAMIIGIAMSFLISPWQMPDEDNHLNLIGYAIGRADFFPQIEASVGIERGRVESNLMEKVDVKEFLAAMIKTPDYKPADVKPLGVALFTLWYLPAIIGMFLAIVLQLPTFWVLQFGELFSLFFYVYVCSKALQYCPIKKGLFAIFMLSPMLMQGGSSFSYDSVAVPLMFWIISYVLYLRFDKDEITFKDMILLIVPWMWLSVVKLPYMFIVFLGLMLPLQKFHVKLGSLEINEIFIRKYRWLALAIICALIAIVLVIMWENPFIQVIYGVVVEFKRTIYLLYRTFINFWDDLLISSVGNFGWMSAPVSMVFAILFYIVIAGVAIVGKDESQKKYTRWDRGVMLFTCLLLTLITIFSMIDHMIMTTWYGGDAAVVDYNIREELYRIDFVGGLQGRYFMPFLSLFFLQFGSFEKLSKKGTKTVVGFFLLVTYGYVGYILLNRFWIG